MTTRNRDDAREARHKHTDAQPEVKLHKRRMVGEEAAYWSASFRLVTRQPGERYWIARTRDAQGEGPIFRVEATAKKNRERVTPEAVVKAVELELAEARGRIAVTELVDGSPRFGAIYDVDTSASMRIRACVSTSDPERCPLTPIPSSEEVEAAFAEIRARRAASRLDEEDASEAEVEAKLAEADEAHAVWQTEREKSVAAVAGKHVH